MVSKRIINTFITYLRTEFDTFFICIYSRIRIFTILLPCSSEHGDFYIFNILLDQW